MGDLEQLLSDTANFFEQLLDQRQDALDELRMLRKQGQEPNVFRILWPGTGLLIRVQDVPE